MKLKVRVGILTTLALVTVLRGGTAGATAQKPSNDDAEFTERHPRPTELRHPVRRPARRNPGCTRPSMTAPIA